MNITKTAGTGVGIVSFERQHLLCANCGDSDSRFVFVSASVNGSGADKVTPAVPFRQTPPIENAAEMENSVATQISAGEDFAGDFQGAAGFQNGPEFFSESQENASFEPGPPAEPVHKFADVLQSYLAKWRQTRQT